MTGPEHYREAERLLAESRTIPRNNDDTCPEADRMIAEAQVRATLAQVAAYALAQPISDAANATGHPSSEHYEEWVSVVEFGDTPAGAAELAGVRERLGALHRSVDSTFDDDGSCIVDGDDWPCATLRALDGPEAGGSA